MALASENVFSYLEDTWEFFGWSLIMWFICFAYADIFYIELAANLCQVFLILNLCQEATQWKVAPCDQSNNTGSLMDWCTIVTRKGWHFVI